MPANNNYNRTIPDAPLPVSMLPRPEALTAQDLLLLIQPNNEQGNKTKALTLAMLAAFLGNIQFDEIVMQGEYGRTLTLNGNGWTFTVPRVSARSDSKSTQLDNTGLNMHALAGGSSGVTDDLDLTPYSIVLKNTHQGLEDTITITKNGLTITTQTRSGSEVTTTTRKITPQQADLELINFFSTDFPASSWSMGVEPYPNQNMAEMMVKFTGSNGMDRLLLACRLMVFRQAQFEKDVTVNADMTIEKTLSVGYGNAEFKNGGVTLSGWLTVAGLTILSAIQHDLSSNNSSIIKCSESANPTLPNYAAGRRLMVINDTQTQHTITGGSRTWPLNGLRAAEFIKTGSTTDDWFPIVTPNSNL